MLDLSQNAGALLMTVEKLTRELLAAVNADPEVALDLFFAASEVVADFDEWGPVLQADENGEYTDETAIVQLRNSRDAIKRLAGWSVD